MKKMLIFLLGVFCTHITSANESVALTGCAAKLANIENELNIAKSLGNDRKVKGLKRLGMQRKNVTMHPCVPNAKKTFARLKIR